MVPDTAYVICYGLFPLVFRIRGDHAHKSIDRSFGIDYDLPSVWKPHDHVRPETSRISGNRFLLVEIAISRHAGKFHNSPEPQFAPRTADLGPAQCCNKAICLTLQLLMHAGKRPELLGKTAEAFVSVLLYV